MTGCHNIVQAYAFIKLLQVCCRLQQPCNDLFVRASFNWSARIIAVCTWVLPIYVIILFCLKQARGPVAAVILFISIVTLCGFVSNSGTWHLSCRRMRGGISVERVREARRALCRHGKAQRMPEGRVLVEIVAEVPAKPAARDQSSSFICRWRAWLLGMLPSTCSTVKHAVASQSILCLRSCRLLISPEPCHQLPCNITLVSDKMIYIELLLPYMAIRKFKSSKALLLSKDLHLPS